LTQFRFLGETRRKQKRSRLDSNGNPAKCVAERIFGDSLIDTSSFSIPRRSDWLVHRADFSDFYFANKTKENLEMELQALAQIRMHSIPEFHLQNSPFALRPSRIPLNSSRNFWLPALRAIVIQMSCLRLRN
jgi:hypothetical protein